MTYASADYVNSTILLDRSGLTKANIDYRSGDFYAIVKSSLQKYEATGLNEYYYGVVTSVTCELDSQIWTYLLYYLDSQKSYRFKTSLKYGFNQSNLNIA